MKSNYLAKVANFILPILLFPASLAQAQTPPVQKDGDTYYEYISPVVSPYNHSLNLPNGEGSSLIQYKTLGQAQSAIAKAQDRAIRELRARYGATVCGLGPVHQTASFSYGVDSGMHRYESKTTVMVLENDGPCEPWNTQTVQAALVQSGISWSYSCPHGYMANGKDANGVMLCRRPLNFCPGVCGNPVTHTSEKFQPELDYRSADGLLELMRTYSSSRYPAPGWSTSFDARILFASPITTAVRPNGARLFFEWNSTKFNSVQPTRTTLTPMSDGGFILTSGDDLKEIYNADGLLTRLVYPDGKAINISRVLENDTMVVTASDPYGRKLMLHHEIPSGGAERYLSRAILPDGSQFEFQNDALNGMITGALREGFQRRYEYSGSKLTDILDENGKHFAEFAYGSTDSGAPTTATGHAGGVEHYMVTDNRHQSGVGSVVVTEPLGANTSYQYANVNGISRMVASTRSGQGTTRMSYDTNGNIASSQDFNGILTRYTHDLSRNLEISRTEGLRPDGSATLETRTIATTWHPILNVPIRIELKDAGGQLVQQTDMTYDHFGHITSHTLQDKLSQQTRRTTYRYTYSSQNPWHVEKLVVTGPRTDVPDVTTIEYWAADAVCPGDGIGMDKGCRGNVKTVTNALNQVTRYDSYDAHGWPVSITNPNGLQTTLRYTARGRLTAITADGETTTHDYDGVGNLKQVTLPAGKRLTYTYDDANRLIGMADNQGNSVSYQLDNMGNRVNEIIKDPSGNLKRQISRRYDNLNRLTHITGAPQ